MFTKSARYYDALYASKDYAGASAKLNELIRHYHPTARTLLDVGCGTGLHVERLQHEYDVAGLDLSPELLAVARARCPDVPFLEADMAAFDTGRKYDVVTCLFSAIGYVRTLPRMRQAVACMARHVETGGLLLIEPWFTPEQYWTGTITSNYVDQPDLKIAWMYTSELDDRLSILDINYLLGTPEGVTHFTERHEIGLFTEDEYQDAFRAAGLAVSYDPVGLFRRGLYIGSGSPSRSNGGPNADAPESRHIPGTE